MIAICASTSAAGAVESDPNQSMHLTNGAIATSYDHCGEMDLCAKIAYPTGSSLAIYS